MAQAHATYEKIEEVWFGGYRSVPFGLWPKVSVRTIFFPLKMVGSHWPTLVASSHLVKPPNSLKQLKMRSQ